MKNFLFVFLLFYSVNVYSENITLLFDYKPNAADVERVLSANKVLEKKSAKVKILFLGNLGVELTYKELVTCGQNCFQNPTCDFTESDELLKFIKSNSFNNMYYKNGEKLIQELGLARVSSSLNYLTKKSLRENKNILIVDLIVPIYPFVPDFEIKIEKESYYLGDIAVAKIKLKEGDQDKKFDTVWKINNEIVGNSSDSIRFDIDSKNTEICCTLEFPGSFCKKSQNLIITAKPCENIIPYVIDIEDKTFFGVSDFDDRDDTRYVQLHEIQNEGEYNGTVWLLPVLFNCPITEFKFHLEEKNESGKRVVIQLDTKDIQFGEVGSLEYSFDEKFGDRNSLTLGDAGYFYYEKITGDSRKLGNKKVIIISGMSEKLMGKEVYLRLIPVEGNPRLMSFPEYKLSFNQCSGSN